MYRLNIIRCTLITIVAVPPGLGVVVVGASVVLKTSVVVGASVLLGTSVIVAASFVESEPSLDGTVEEPSATITPSSTV